VIDTVVAVVGRSLRAVNPIKHYGQMELGLNKYGIDQKGPIHQFLV
jgi:hypothetical protein